MHVVHGAGADGESMPVSNTGGDTAATRRQVILKEDVPNVGKKGELTNVINGYW